MEPLPRAFFARPTAKVARALLGCYVVREREGEREREGARGRGREREGRRARVPHEPLVLRIVETEAYLGPEDPGSHARLGRHTRGGRLWAEPGTAYVYLCYGVHDMLNVVAHESGEVGAVLLRAAEPVAHTRALRRRRARVPLARVASGPGNLARCLGLDAARHDGVDLTRPPLMLARGSPVPAAAVGVTGRIGLTSGSPLPLRFIDVTSASLSRPPPGRRTTPRPVATR